LNVKFGINKVDAPGERFNLAQHLLESNLGRPVKAAFVDDLGALSFTGLDTRVRRMAAGLRKLGLRREERVLLLTHDCNDWPVSFLGAMFA
jgi:benzoate-CoA ligase